MSIYPSKLKAGDEIRIIAPACSFSLLSEECRNIAQNRLTELGFKVTFGKNIEECDMFNSSSVESRIEDLHEAFLDTNVKAIFTVIGGFNANQLLKYIDWDVVKNNPKIFCGFSDITALSNAIYSKTGIVTYSGMNYANFGEKLYLEYSLDYFKKCLIQGGPFEILPSEYWSNDKWYQDQDNRKLIKNEGWWILNEGNASGKILGGNLCTFNLLHGTEFMPKFIEDTILFIEDDSMSENQGDVEFDRNLQSVIHQPGFENVKGLVIGRFEQATEMTKEKLTYIVKTKEELKNIPVIANVDFGHTNPLITFPIGGITEINTNPLNITIKEH